MKLDEGEKEKECLKRMSEFGCSDMLEKEEMNLDERERMF